MKEQIEKLIKIETDLIKSKIKCYNIENNIENSEELTNKIIDEYQNNLLKDLDFILKGEDEK